MAIIRVSGPPRAGKTSASDRLAPALSYGNIYTGAVFMAMAEEKGMRKEDFFRALADDPELEKEIDRRQEEIMMSRDNIVIQGRIAPFLRAKPGARVINVLITASLDVRAEREFLESNGRHQSVEEAKNSLQSRAQDERVRYKSLYPHIADYLDERCFDIVVDTTNIDKEETFQTLLAKIKALI